MADRIPISEAIRRFDVSRATVVRWIEKGQVDAVKAPGPSGEWWLLDPDSVGRKVAAIQPRTIVGRNRIADLERRVAALEARLDRLEELRPG